MAFSPFQKIFQKLGTDICPLCATQQEDFLNAPCNNMASVLSEAGKSRSAMDVAEHYKDNIKERVFLVTGAYSGIGVTTTTALLAAGAKTVVVCGRNASLQQEFVDKLRKEYDERQIDGEKTVDLTSLDSVKEFAYHVKLKYDQIDVAIFNAGVMATPPSVTKEGHELQFGVNVVGHFLLAKILAPKTKRQVWVSSHGHSYFGGDGVDIDKLKNFSLNGTSKYDAFSAYQQSKMGNVVLAKEFPKRCDGLEGVSLHPGMISTNISRNMTFFSTMPLFLALIKDMLTGHFHMKTPEQGAATTITCAALPSAELQLGAYYSDCEVAKEAQGATTENAKKVFDYCDDITKAFQ